MASGLMTISKNMLDTLPPGVFKKPLGIFKFATENFKESTGYRIKEVHMPKYNIEGQPYFGVDVKKVSEDINNKIYFNKNVIFIPKINKDHWGEGSYYLLDKATYASIRANESVHAKDYIKRGVLRDIVAEPFATPRRLKRVEGAAQQMKEGEWYIRHVAYELIPESQSILEIISERTQVAQRYVYLQEDQSEKLGYRGLPLIELPEALVPFTGIKDGGPIPVWRKFYDSEGHKDLSRLLGKNKDYGSPAVVSGLQKYYNVGKMYVVPTEVTEGKFVEWYPYITPNPFVGQGELNPKGIKSTVESSIHPTGMPANGGTGIFEGATYPAVYKKWDHIIKNDDFDPNVIVNEYANQPNRLFNMFDDEATIVED